MAQSVHDLGDEPAQLVVVVDDEDARAPGDLRDWRGRALGDARSLDDRQRHREADAAAGDILGAHPATVRLHDADGEAEPEARALAGRLGREEGVEDPAEVLGRDPGAVILYLDRDRRAVAPGADGQHTLPVRGPHRVDGVAEEVQQHLLELVGVGPDPRRRIERGDDPDVIEVELRGLQR